MSHDPASTPGDPGSCFDAARRVLAEERRRIRAERDAFDAFLSRLDSLPVAAAPTPSAAAPAESHATLTANAGQPGHAGTAAVREAYADTVMAVPHYDEDYGDTYRESVAAEFGADLACALDTEPAVTPLLLDQLRTAGRAARTERDTFLDALATEAAALDDAETKLAAVRDELAAVRSRPLYECPADELTYLSDDLDHLTVQCDALVAARQAALRRQRRTLNLPDDVPHLARYLYRDLDTTYPILAAVAAVADDLRAVETQVETSLAIWDATPVRD